MTPFMVSFERQQHPDVCFRIEGATSLGAEEVPQLLERHLRSRFAAAPVIKMGIFAPRVMTLTVHGKPLSAVLGRSRYGHDEWILIVGPAESPSLLDRLRGRRVLCDQPELRELCREIHHVLTRIPA